MPSAQHSVIIDRPIDEVFASCSEPTNEFKWRSQVKEITTEGPAAVGRRVHQAVKGPGGLRIPADIEVAGFEPAARYAFRGVAGPIRPVGEFLFSAKEEHTRVSFSLSVELTGIKKVLMSRAVQRAMDGEVKAIDQQEWFSSILESQPTVGRLSRTHGGCTTARSGIAIPMRLFGSPL